MFARSFTRLASRQTVQAVKARAFSTAPRAAANARWTAVAAATAVAGAAYAYNVQTPIQANSKSLAGVKGTETERTFIAVKPDGVHRGLVHKVIERFENRGYKLVGLKAVVPSRQLTEEHYADLKSKPFFKGLVDYMSNGEAPVIAMVWEGPDVIKQGRAMIGATNPLQSAPGTIRGEYCVSVGRNAIHGSDSFESAEKEISLWFGKAGELIDWKRSGSEWVISNN
ncbi:NDK-domain-containing protein [Hesseltinella vesiculosa]|uniref:Nucleoside diphosphate kinase n=1 Tax=Hesseltinella vesiculosa TaxID=101127 RepID=A0A1X2GJX7_9FUNG|nr:NDK-domain-containing protein [Hesseltinella vesiculosa]